MQRGVMWTYEMNNIAPRIVPADVPLSERIQSPISSLTLIRAYRLDKKSVRYLPHPLVTTTQRALIL